VNERGIKTRHVFWAIFPITLGILLAVVATNSIGYEPVKTNVPTENQNTAGNFYFIKDPNKKPTINAEAYFVGDLDTGEIILQKNANKIFPIASVSKLMTATISKENQNQEAIIKVSKSALATSGENGNLHLNEKIKVSDLIYPLLLESSNDAAEVLAENSGRNTFIQKMNAKARNLALFNTSFLDPSGLSEKNQSNVSDLFKFSQYLKEKIPSLLQISTLRSYKTKNHIWFNISQFLNIPGYEGGKRGYTDESKETVVSLFNLPLGQTGVRNIGITLLRSTDRYKDVKSILNYLYKNVYYGNATDANLAWVKSKEGILETEPNFVTLLFGGDLMLDRGVKSSVLKNLGGDYSMLFEKLNILNDVDIAFANLEGPASDQGINRNNLYSFRMDPSVIPALKGAGFDVLSVANNHMGDWGRNAYADTLARLKENEILYTGGGINALEAEQPTIIEKNGIRIGYLSFTDVGPNWLKVDEKSAGVMLASNPRFDEIIKNAAGKVDDLVVSFHFGDEYKIKHNKRQETLAHRAIDDGAKIIIGTHPHVVEDTEVYKNGYIAYSLGNLIFDQSFSKNTMQGMLLQIKLGRDGTMTAQKDAVQLNKTFQPDTITLGVEEKVK
jgi:D-alanyl-D-alanine carboxypeptidase